MAVEISEWKQKFDKDTLERGKSTYLKRRVDDLKEVEDGYLAAVLGKKRFEVSVKVKDGKLGRMRCKCPVAKAGRNCEHMAAVLYAIAKPEDAADLMASWLKMDEKLKQKEKQKESKSTAEELKRQREEEEERLAEQRRMEEERLAKESQRKQEREKQLKEQEVKKRLDTEFTLLGDSWAQENEDLQATAKTVKQLEKYKYFDGKSITKSMKIPKDKFDEGERLIRQGKIRVERIYSGYGRGDGQPVGVIEAQAWSGKEEFPVKLSFSQKEVLLAECRCVECRKNYYYYWNGTERKCACIAGLLKELERYLEQHNIGDATDSSARWLMEFYQEKRANRIMADSREEGELKFVPRLTKKEGELSVSFKIGEGKLFIVKQLDEFCENVKNSATALYGTSTEINHAPERFTQKAQGWIRFINRVV